MRGDGGAAASRRTSPDTPRHSGETYLPLPARRISESFSEIGYEVIDDTMHGLHRALRQVEIEERGLETSMSQ